MPTERDGNFGVDQGPDPGPRTRPSLRGRSRFTESRPSFAHMFYRWDDPLTWSVGLFPWCGYRVGVHWITVFWVALQLMLSVPVGNMGLQHIAMAVGSILAVVVLRESARLWIARRVGSEPEYVVLWPLGALIGPTAPRALTPKLLVILTPTLVSVSLGLVLLGALLALDAPRELLVFNPFDVRQVVRLIDSPGQALVWWAFFANIVVGGLNLLPMMPLDGGRLFEAWAWRTRRDRARRLVGQISLAVAGLVTITGITATQPHLIALAVFGGFAGWLELRRSEFVEEPLVPQPSLPPDWIVGAEPARPADAPDFRAVYAAFDTDPETTSAHDREPAKPEIEGVDHILAKISATGMASLTDDERHALARETRRLKGE